MKINIIRDDGLATDFAAKVQEFINYLEKHNCKIIDIKYAVHDIGPNIVREALIMYEVK